MNRRLRQTFPRVGAFACAAALLATALSAEPSWEPLFDGESLDGWTQLGGAARYAVEDGAIVGTSALDTPNSFLATDRRYEDFVLEFEFKLDAGLNSGVQFRSQSEPDYRDGRVHGYQFELDSSERAWTAGIYDEEHRGWLYPVDLHPAARSLYNPEQWNRARIECVGDVTRTFLNGQPVAFLVDQPGYRRAGFIALQVHSIAPDSGHEGRQVRWRNLRIAEADDRALAQDEPGFFIRNLATNSLHPAERAQGWQLLFDGESAPGFAGTDAPSLPDSWAIQGGELTVNPDGPNPASADSIVTRQDYGAFELQLDFKLTQGANSGIKYFVSQYKRRDSGELERVGPEYQLLDDARHPDARQGIDGNRTCASLYDLIPSAKRLHGRPMEAPTETWNHARVVARADGRVEHWLNGYKVVEYDRGSEGFRELVSKSKYSEFIDFGQIEAGRILLQDHGDTVSFRSIKIREL